MLDISFTGASVSVKQGNRQTIIKEFSDEGTPIECNDVEVTGSAVTLNGQLILWRKPCAYVVSLTVIPRSDNDETLLCMLHDAHVTPGNVVKISNLNASLTIVSPKINESGSQISGDTWKFTNGRIVSGPTGPASSAEGKMSARTYTFVFEKLAQSGAGTNVVAK